MPFGATVLAGGGAQFRLWAPAARSVTLVLEGGAGPHAATGAAGETGGAAVPASALRSMDARTAEPERPPIADRSVSGELAMAREPGDWFTLVCPAAGPGTRYRYRIDGEQLVPDPASRFQPADVHGPSEVIDPSAFAWLADTWRGRRWRGRPWHEAVVYELHVGAFTAEGTFAGVESRLDHLAALGITAIELMPIADFPGARNWGYDGVLPFAPDARYGRPEALKSLVQAAHGRGLMVLLDVVYNHFGPEGNYLHCYAPQFFTDRHRTPWGAAIDFDGPASERVRAFFIHNALFWLEEYRLDGLRLDAVHAIADDSGRHILEELARAVREGPGREREVHLVLENDANQGHYLRRDAAGRPLLYDAQWNDDLHHALHVLITGEREAYYCDYAAEPARMLGRALAEGFAYQGEPSPHRRGARRGDPTGGLPPSAFVAFLQNHDQVGNRAFGERISRLAGEPALAWAASILALAPAPPLLFMGEEWSSRQPFPFFCDFPGELAAAVREGRRDEFARFAEFRDPASRARIPDPGAESTFRAAVLDWSDADRPEGRTWIERWRRLLALRAREVIPRLKDWPGDAGTAAPATSAGSFRLLTERVLRVEWSLAEGSRLALVANASDADVAIDAPEAAGTLHEKQMPDVREAAGTRHAQEAPNAAEAPVASWSPAWRCLHAVPEGAAAEFRAGRLPAWSAVWLVDDASSRLRAGAASRGIQVAYRDVHQATRHASASALRAVLAALGDGTAGGWTGALPPVVVHRSNAGPPSIPVAPPDVHAGQRIDWRLDLEDGGVERGAFEPFTLPVVEEPAVAGAPAHRRRFVLPHRLPEGVHRLTLVRGGAPRAQDDRAALLGETRLIVVPPACHRPAWLDHGPRPWGIAIQLHALRSARNWGIGDFTDLATLVESAAAMGAGAVGINPLHALHPANPEHASPYSPSSRLLLNVLYLDVETIPEFADCPQAQRHLRSAEFRARLAALREAPLIDLAGVKEAKFEVLAHLHRRFVDTQVAPDSDRARAFAAFRDERGEALAALCLHDALQEHFLAVDGALWGWPVWPEPYRDPGSAEVARFAAECAERIGFFAWLQWQAELQLSRVAERARALLAIGLYADLALGAGSGSAEVWAAQRLFALAAGAGAPPDAFNPGGQSWGLPPMRPGALVQAGYQPWIDILRANMRHAGALRIDHVMALERLYWVPAGHDPADGAYVRYPLDDLIGILALESRRSRCAVIGEDLGTVPDSVREVLHQHGVLSTRLLWFERDAHGGLRPAAEYPQQALVAVSTHDLPTLAGFWKGRDIALREELGMFADAAERDRQLAARAADRLHLWQALRSAGLLPEAAKAGPSAVEPTSAEFGRAVHAMLARAPSRLLMVQPEDVFGSIDQVNLPGSSGDRHPNWRRRIEVPLESWPADSRWRQLAQALREGRGETPGDPSGSPAALGARSSAPGPVRIPRATYRLQLHREFGFAAVTSIVPYLDALGISDAYLSPYFKARAGSRHGYDIVEHGSLNPEIGDRRSFDALCAALSAHGMSQLIDVVPNHMGVHGSDNPWWLDVLENGRASAYAEFFDIDWEPRDGRRRGQLLLPVLGDQFGIVLERGELAPALDRARGEISIRYFEHRFPVDPSTYGMALRFPPDSPAPLPGTESDVHVEYRALIEAFARLPSRLVRDRRRLAERDRDKEQLKRRLAELLARAPDLARRVDDNLARIAGRAGEPRSFDTLADWLDAQAYRLAYWRVAGDEINYRRFFDINELAGLRMEDEGVFELTHSLVLELVASGRVGGLRIDHPDGLYDPAAYFSRLAGRCARVLGREGEARPIYLVIEKILAAHERLPETWPVHGTTGYRFANVSTGLFVDAAQGARFDRLYRAFAGDQPPLAEIAIDGKTAVLRRPLAGELGVLSHALARIAEADRRTRDFTLPALHDALAQVIACFPVYRTYIDGDGVRAEDRRSIEWAVGVARGRGRAEDPSLFDFIRDVLTGAIGERLSAAGRRRVTEFVMKFQQLTGPVMAKGFEDTALYRYHCLVALNEVGGNPDQFGVGVEAFHRASGDRARHWPHTLLATSTHDTKRSEDVRLRLAVLSELPAGWRLVLRRWRRMAVRRKTEVDGRPAPSANDEYLLYQTLVGAWPLDPPSGEALAAFRERIEGYMSKAIREAKRETSWVHPHPAYEQAMQSFVQSLLHSRPRNPFVADLQAFVDRIAHFGLLNGLAQTLLKLASPGVPDFYQGTELWRFDLVDPDNRRPVDYVLRKRMLEALRAGMADAVRSGRADAQTSRSDEPPSGMAEAQPTQSADAARIGESSSGPRGLAGFVHGLAGDLTDARAKLYLVWRGLDLRRTREPLFRDGEYVALPAEGARAEHVIAFARRHGEQVVIAIAPRLCYRLLDGERRLPVGEGTWGDTRVPLPAEWGDLRWTDHLTGAVVSATAGDPRQTDPAREGRANDLAATGGGPAIAMRAALAHFPVALLVGEGWGEGPEEGP